MLSRRIFGGCALCAGLGLIGGQASAQAPAAGAGLARTIVSKVSLPASPYDVLQVLVTIDPGFLVARHTHPGTESSIILEGGGTLGVKGASDRVLGPGESFLIPPEVPHLLQNKGATTKVIATYTVDRGKPLATPAPQ
jgi:quercetin dioxygenase-like cupin family protein